MEENFDSIKEMIPEFISLFIKFSKCKDEEVLVKSLGHLKKIIDKMIVNAGSKPLNNNESIFEDSKSDSVNSNELQANESRQGFESNNA